MRRPTAQRLPLRTFLRLTVVGLAAQLATACAIVPNYGGVGTVTSGMNQTELQGVMGPPDYIQVKGQQQAWQYCPHLFDGHSEDLYATFWFRHGTIEHMRAYPEHQMGSCEDFIAAFRWDDTIEGDFADKIAGK